MDGNYTAWSNWTSCSTTCGPGQQERRRNCTEPRRAHGGADCQGPATEIRECFMEQICPGRSLIRKQNVCKANVKKTAQTLDKT